MPTPIGHALAGLAVAGASRKAGDRIPASHVAILMFCAVAPDLDLALRLLDGVNHHRGPSHSLGAAVLAGMAGLLVRRLGADLPSAWAISSAWASHVLLDYLGLDTSPPIGEMALWPVSGAFFASPVSVFYDIPRSFSGWAIRHNALAVAIELAVLAPLTLICWGRLRPRGTRR